MNSTHNNKYFYLKDNIITKFGFCFINISPILILYLLFYFSLKHNVKIYHIIGNHDMCYGFLHFYSAFYLNYNNIKNNKIQLFIKPYINLKLSKFNILIKHNDTETIIKHVFLNNKKYSGNSFLNFYIFVLICHMFFKNNEKDEENKINKDEIKLKNKNKNICLLSYCTTTINKCKKQFGGIILDLEINKDFENFFNNFISKEELFDVKQYRINIDNLIFEIIKDYEKYKNKINDQTIFYNVLKKYYKISREYDYIGYSYCKIFLDCYCLRLYKVLVKYLNYLLKNKIIKQYDYAINLLKIKHILLFYEYNNNQQLVLSNHTKKINKFFISLVSTILKFYKENDSKNIKNYEKIIKTIFSNSRINYYEIYEKYINDNYDKIIGGSKIIKENDKSENNKIYCYNNQFSILTKDKEYEINLKFEYEKIKNYYDLLIHGHVNVHNQIKTKNNKKIFSYLDSGIFNDSIYLENKILLNDVEKFINDNKITVNTTYSIAKESVPKSKRIKNSNIQYITKNSEPFIIKNDKEIFIDNENINDYFKSYDANISVLGYVFIDNNKMYYLKENIEVIDAKLFYFIFNEQNNQDYWFDKLKNYKKIEYDWSKCDNEDQKYKNLVKVNSKEIMKIRY